MVCLTHLGMLILFACFTFQGGGIPRRSAPILQSIREEVSFLQLDLFLCVCVCEW